MPYSKYTPENVTRALDAHKAAGLIRGWEHNANAPWKRGGTERPFYLFVNPVDGQEVELRNLREAGLFCDALASADHAIKRAAAS